VVLSGVDHSHRSAAHKIIYIVDPDASEQERLESALTPTFGHVKAFNDVESFLAQCGSTQEGCLITISVLPEMSVLEFIDRLKREGIRLPVIVLGEDSKMPLTVNVMRAGAADFIERPLTDRRLREAVRKAIT
jgi:FixJ family two-component response regulator